MRRIFTSTIFIAAFSFAITNTSFAQCAFSSTNPGGFPGATNTFNSSAEGFTGNLSYVGGFTDVLRTTTGSGTRTITTPIYYRSSTQSTILARFSINMSNNNDNITNLTVQAVTNTTTYTLCTFSSLTVSPNNTTTYYATLPVGSLPASVNFQLKFVFTQQGQFDFDNFGVNVSTANGSLPVKFQTLDARTLNNSVSLKWDVATEENLSGYSIERSTDGRSFSQIAFVSASGESNYSFVDSKPLSVSYYRIKSVDLNGRYGYSTVALVKSGKSSIVLKAFPTPFIKNVSIQHPTAIAGNSITISSSDGRVIKTIIPAAGAQQTDVDLSSAKSGLYLVRFNGANGESETLKLLKQ